MKKKLFKSIVACLLAVCLATLGILSIAAAGSGIEDEYIYIVESGSNRYGISEHDEEGYGAINSKANLTYYGSSKQVRADLATVSRDSSAVKSLNIQIRVWGAGNPGLINGGNPLSGTADQIYNGYINPDLKNGMFYTINHYVNTHNASTSWEATTQYICGGGVDVGMYNPTQSIG